MQNSPNSWFLRIDLEPMGAARQTPTIRGGRLATFKPEKYEAWCKNSDERIGWMLGLGFVRNSAQVWVLKGARVGLTCVFERPATRPKAVEKANWHEGRVRRLCKPDSDNCWKAATDSFQRTVRNFGLDFDDSCFEGGNVDRFYAAAGERPSFTLHFSPLEGAKDA